MGAQPRQRGRPSRRGVYLICRAGRLLPATGKLITIHPRKHAQREGPAVVHPNKGGVGADRETAHRLPHARTGAEPAPP